ncbi:MAG: type II toxin-antitoxin system MqsA family antitoxin [Oscillochloridaceae bacterium umkhey_bin13]
MKCVICRQAETMMGTTTVTLTRDKLTLVVRDVPASVCPNCGEAYVREDAVVRLLSTAEQLEQAGTQVDVRDYAA